MSSQNLHKSLTNAAKGGNLELVKCLDQEGNTDFYQALQDAAEKKDFSLINRVLAERNTYLQAPLAAAAEGGHMDVVAYLTENGATIQSDSRYI